MTCCTSTPATKGITRWRTCCGVPGCRNRLYLEVHHADPRARGGGDDERNLVVLCSQHHRLLHDGHMGAEVLPDGVLRFSFRDGRVLMRPPGQLDLPPDGVPRGTGCVPIPQPETSEAGAPRPCPSTG